MNKELLKHGMELTLGNSRTYRVTHALLEEISSSDNKMYIPLCNYDKSMNHKFLSELDVYKATDNGNVVYDKWQSKTSGDISKQANRQFSTGAIRDSADGKGRYDLIPYEGLHRLCLLLEKGAKKYGERNAEKGIPQSCLMDSATRHLSKYMMGWDDEDHLAAVVWNIMFAMQNEQVRQEMQDIPSRKDKRQWGMFTQ